MVSSWGVQSQTAYLILNITVSMLLWLVYVMYKYDTRVVEARLVEV